MNCVSCDLCVYHPGLFVFFPRVFLSFRVTGACPVTTDLIMRANVRTTTTTTTVKRKVSICFLVCKGLSVDDVGVSRDTVFQEITTGSWL